MSHGFLLHFFNIKQSPKAFHIDILKYNFNKSKSLCQFGSFARNI